MRVFVFSGRLYCARHGEKRRRAGGQTGYCCLRGICVNRGLDSEAILPIVMTALDEINEEQIRGYFDTGEVRRRRAVT